MKNSGYLLLLFVFVIALLAGCTGDKESEQASANEYYTCPMHPTVRSDKPGVCPVCNMTLVKASSIAQDTAANTIQIVEAQQPLANIKIDTVKRGSINDGLVILGVTSYNENSSTVITARANGRIEKLVKRNPGESIKKGDLLYLLYSEELSAAENEFITAFDHQQKYPGRDSSVEKLLHSSRTRLRLAGITESQIRELERSRKVSGTVSFYSESQGNIVEVPVKEGEYVETGAMIYNLADLSTLWVDAQLYNNESFSQLSSSAEVEYEDKTYKASVDLIKPSLEENSKISIVKFRIENEDLGLKPGMMVSVRLKGKDRKALLIPKTALLIGKMPVVWVKIGPELFESRMVKTGMESGQMVEIIDGLQPGDLVVSSGAYLVNSEFVLKKGASAQHQHAH